MSKLGYEGPFSEPLKNVTTFGNAGSLKRCFRFFEAEAVAEFVSTQSNWVVLGKGSNLLIDPETEKSVLFLDKRISDIQHDGCEWTFSAGMGVTEAQKITRDSGYSGLEMAAGVPSTIGGMVAMNFGCWGEEIGNYVKAVSVLTETGQFLTLMHDDLKFGYRKSLVSTTRCILLSVTLILKPDSPDKIKERAHNNIGKRLDSQPLKKRTFGCMYKNPDGLFAAWLIEESGLKGFRRGDVAISDMHSNFLVNQNNATFDETVGMLDYIEATVLGRTGVTLEREVQIIR